MVSNMLRTRIRYLAAAALLAASGCGGADNVPGGTDAAADADGASTDGAAADAGPDAAPALYSYDLDGDGTNDSNLSVRSCGDEAQPTCLWVESTVVADAAIQIASTAPTCEGTLSGRRIEVIGNHAGDDIHEVAVFHCRNDGENAPPAMAVVDVSAGSVIAETVAPAVQKHAFADYPRGPDGKRYPFLAPSYGDGLNADGNWGYVCIYRPDLPGGSPCGTGFSSVSAAPNGGNYFREVGGYLQDLDADGWEDISLIYHQSVQSISPATLGELDYLVYDVAASTEPSSPAWFHSGRNYGTHAAVTGTDGMLRTIEVGGAPVGTFTDYNCNVSRFVAVLDSVAGNPASRTMRWSHYYGFASTIFSAYDPQYASDPSVVVARPADVMDGCVHRFSDSRSVMDGEEVIVFNYFVQDAPFDRCLEEQYALYLPPTWTPEKTEAWYGCFEQNVQSMGVWGMQVLRESDGVGRTGSLNTYVWGRSDELLPSGEMVYLVEILPGSGRFDLADRTPSALAVYALVDGLWSSRGNFPLAGRPKIRFEMPAGSRGVGSFTYYAELTLDDVDHDDLADVQLESGDWVGYDSSSGTFAIK